MASYDEINSNTLRANSSLLIHLHCLTHPELLPLLLQQAFVIIFPKYMHKPKIRRNHTILVELHNQLCKTHKPTRLFDVFHFFGESINEFAIPLCKNILNLNEKEQFGLFAKRRIEDRDDHSPDWNQDNEDINCARMEESIRQYFPEVFCFLSTIACDMYIERKDHDFEDSLYEVKSTEEFFWSKNGVPLIHSLCY
ncbi:hypothetical protein RFI_38574 [Reticulomyxa filosa]|uniref:Uncharacterized protein n=1 Tax=Reticulomyxa filosa TaxID=46433 RepID=X6LA78_RETFI|nr:hypothetical protein RFI_38574 [Reticulomyxa filosa]|eukprot:ETN98912.1 hypothetical protein RFI_38574 [Reticulomyxa filosa]